jgi:electron transfer flavoprotein beta subunit
MKIIVCINRVRYIYQPGAIALSGQIDEEKTVFMLNPYDEAAVEEAIRIKEKIEDSEVILVIVGREETEQTLRYACAMGGPKIDRLLRIDHDHFDPWTSSLLLAKVIDQIGYDIIFCGKKIIDSNATQTGAFISAFLDIPLVSGIVVLELFPQDRRAVVAKSLGKGDTEEIECMLPALFTTEMGINEPRYPTVPDRFLAGKKEIDVVDPHAFGIDFTEEGTLMPIKKLSPPRLKARNVRIPDRNLSAIERLEMMKSGGGTKKDGGASLEGSPQESAEYIAEFLIQNRIVNETNLP